MYNNQLTIMGVAGLYCRFLNAWVGVRRIYEIRVTSVLLVFENAAGSITVCTMGRKVDEQGSRASGHGTDCPGEHPESAAGLVHHLAHSDFTGNHWPDRIMRRDFDERMTALDWPVVPREIGAGRFVSLACFAFRWNRDV